MSLSASVIRGALAELSGARAAAGRLGWGASGEGAALAALTDEEALAWVSAVASGACLVGKVGMKAAGLGSGRVLK
jgi:hypothetical protein